MPCAATTSELIERDWVPISPAKRVAIGKMIDSSSGKEDRSSRASQIIEAPWIKTSYERAIASFVTISAP